MEKIKQFKGNLLGKWVKFRVGKGKHFGKVSNIDHNVCNIMGVEQKKYSRPAYHYDFREVRICSHDEVFKIK